MLNGRILYHIEHYYKIFLGGVGLFLMEAGSNFDRRRYSQAG